MASSIVVSEVSKRYVKYEDAPMLMSRLVSLRSRTRRSRLWALRDVDFEIAKGESVGVIGRNGSGKTTLLRLLAGVSAPTKGSVTVRGRVSPLIAVGVGFHQELTGRENVYVNGIVLGLTRAEIDRRFDEIVDFADVAEFIDVPVKFYSSGMSVRLGFAVAVSANPGVLLVDEVLAVGDVAFQAKCFDRMMAVRDSGTTIVVVSHNLNAIRRMCDRSIVLHRGELRFDGETADAIGRYHELLAERDPFEDGTEADDAIDVHALVRNFRLLGTDGEPTAHLDAGDELVARFEVEFERDVVDPALLFTVTNELGVHAYATIGQVDGGGRAYRAGEVASFDVCAATRLTTGSYTIGAMLMHGTTHLPISVARQAACYIANPSPARGVVDLEARFTAASTNGDGR